MPTLTTLSCQLWSTVGSTVIPISDLHWHHNNIDNVHCTDQVQPIYIVFFLVLSMCMYPFRYHYQASYHLQTVHNLVQSNSTSWTGLPCKTFSQEILHKKSPFIRHGSAHCSTNTNNNLRSSLQLCCTCSMEQYLCFYQISGLFEHFKI